VDVGDALLDQQHVPIVVRLCALLTCRRHLPNEEHHLSLTAKGRGDLLDGNTVEKEVVSIPAVVHPQGGFRASLL
jgi:hypothetical protein